jgi:hypothetical protein
VRAAVKKQKVIIPSLKEHMIALMEELVSAPVEEQIEVLTAINQMLDNALDVLAEEKRPKGKLTTDAVGRPAIVGALPAGSVRVEFDLQARKQFPGECLCKSYLAAIKENN